MRKLGLTNPYHVDDEMWERLIDLTKGEASSCFQCGTCTAICPWGLVKDETLSIHKLIRMVQLGIQSQDQDLWLCTTCSQCDAGCPRGVDIPLVVQGLRQFQWEQRAVPTGLPSVLWSIYWNNNPWSQPPSYRDHWATQLDIPAFDAEAHEILLYIGCTASYDRRAGSIARALIQVLRAAEVSFGILGNDEPCCGEAAASLGYRPYFDELAHRAAHFFHDRGVRSVVTLSPHCYHVFRKDYIRLYRDLEPLHYTKFLANLVESGRLTFSQTCPIKVTFHDPCFLARHHAGIAPPRAILDAIPGLGLVEMIHSGPDTICCGGGGGRMWMETNPGERFADLRVEMALDTGATVLATACPYCVTCLEDSIKSLKITNLTVLDVAEIAARALDGQQYK
jgi:Fe-S oxidoreductase